MITIQYTNRIELNEHKIIQFINTNIFYNLKLNTNKMLLSNQKRISSYREKEIAVSCVQEAQRRSLVDVVIDTNSRANRFLIIEILRCGIGANFGPTVHQITSCVFNDIVHFTHLGNRYDIIFYNYKVSPFAFLLGDDKRRCDIKYVDLKFDFTWQDFKVEAKPTENTLAVASTLCFNIFQSFYDNCMQTSEEFPDLSKFLDVKMSLNK